MRIKGIRAADFMRFSRVDLSGLPAAGLFAVQGANESGKSTLGHLVYFALSGEPLHGGAATELIHWERTRLRVELDFEHDGISCHVERQVDRNGTTVARLEVAGAPPVQGVPQVLRRLHELLGYDPRGLRQSFIITQRVLHGLILGDAPGHVEFMTGLDRIGALERHGAEQSQALQEKVENTTSAMRELEAERGDIGYSADEEAALGRSLSTLGERRKMLEGELRQKALVLEDIQHQIETVEGESKFLPGKLDEDHFHQLCADSPAVTRRLKALQLQGKSAECLQQVVTLLEEMVRYKKGCDQLAEKIEAQLNQYRFALGMHGDESTRPNPNSVKVREDKALRSLRRNVRMRNFWGWMAGITFVCMVVATLGYAYQVAILGFLKGVHVDKLLLNPSLHEWWVSFKNVFRPGVHGLPVHPLALAIMAGSMLALLLEAAGALLGLARIRTLKFRLDEIGAEKKRLQNEYHILLAVDIKDVLEMEEVITRGNNASLREDFVAFKANHKVFADVRYKTDVVLHHIRQNFDRTCQALHARLHQNQLDMQQVEEQMASMRSSINEVEPALENMRLRKVRHDDVQARLAGLDKDLDSARGEFAVLQCMRDLAAGCRAAMLDRLRIRITQAYKAILPAITNGRYASVKLDEQFRISVFSGERNDFVPLAQLSTGTVDLFMLIFQLLLTHAFMESRGVAGNFIFLDEPLQAVDAQRYKVLTDLLPSVFPRFTQVFLCRPPAEAQAVPCINTSLESSELVASLGG